MDNILTQCKSPETSKPNKDYPSITTKTTKTQTIFFLHKFNTFLREKPTKKKQFHCKQYLYAPHTE